MKRDALLILGALGLCPLVARFAPATPPVGRTEAFAGFERRLGLFFEPAVHAWLVGHSTLLVAAGLFYVWVHVPATLGALVWARLERPRTFPLARDTFVATQVITITVYVLFPVAPPSLLPGFSDTLAAVYGSGGERLAHSVQSPYASMPSGHVAFAVVAAGTVWFSVRSRALRAAAVAYPPIVVAMIVGTANHLWIDAAGGLTAAALGFGAALGVRAITAPIRVRRRPRTQGDDGDPFAAQLPGRGDRGGPGRPGGGVAAAGPRL